jgi:sigma-E factor negative regulatory protein RseB
MIDFPSRCALVDGLVPAFRQVMLASLLFAFIPAQAAEDPRRWLERMNDALMNHDYRGEFSYYDGTELASLRIFHAVIDGEQRERLIHLDGSDREIVRHGDVVSCVLDRDDRMLEFTESIPAGPFARSFSHGLATVPDGYAVEMAGRGRIAERQGHRVELIPGDGSRYGYRLWLDDETGMLLRSELLDPSGDRLEIFQFVRIEMDVPVSEAQLSPELDGDRVRHRLAFAEPGAEEGDSGARQHAWKAGWLPGGFTMTATDIRRVPAHDRPVHTLRYSDGLASFSVFVERSRGQPGWQHSRRRGATSAVMRELEVADQGRFLVTVVGEIPMDTAERVAGSIEAVR